ncbi:MAG: quinolinate synthase NadA [Oligoflexia bacterium]|nr:quinolinate synthase NadA [Oligoflexia bacterium]
MININSDTNPSQINDRNDQNNQNEILSTISKLKQKLKDVVVILGHHYQQDDIIQFADVVGDSLILSQTAAKLDKPYIVFCGVHFMAETADILCNSRLSNSRQQQKVILPDLSAGCSMADMANINDVETAWNILTEVQQRTKNVNKIIPITYINCAADLKAFVGKHGGYICTSSNAEKVISHALKFAEQLLFFPDQHLGRNTCYRMGIPLEQMPLYRPTLPSGGLSSEEIANAKVILWDGYCSVHQVFLIEQIVAIRATTPDIKIIVHPECSFDVVQAADLVGSTAYISQVIADAPPGSKFAVGTEINLVNRLAKRFPQKEIHSLSHPYPCLCSTMYRIQPKALLAALRSIENKKPINVISVNAEIREAALLALQRMLEIS